MKSKKAASQYMSYQECIKECEGLNNALLNTFVKYDGVEYYIEAVFPIPVQVVKIIDFNNKLMAEKHYLDAIEPFNGQKMQVGLQCLDLITDKKILLRLKDI